LLHQQQAKRKETNMLTTRNYVAIALAALISGVFSHSLIGAGLGAAMGLAIWYFRTWTPANDTRLTPVELCFSLTLVTVNFFALMFARQYLVARLFTEAFMGAFMGLLIVGICIMVFGPPRR
jgi:hypothetical protein